MSGFKLTLSKPIPAPAALAKVLAATRSAPPAAPPAPAPAQSAAAPAQRTAAPGQKAVAPKPTPPAQRAVVPAPKVVAPKAPKPERPPVFEHAPADAETVAWNQAREREWLAAHPPVPERPPPFVHRPAYPETIAWNRARDAEWEAEQELIGTIKVQTMAAIEALVRDLCPTTFCRPPVPLAIGIHHALYELLAGDFEPIQVCRFLRSWPRQSVYQETLIEGAARVDLNGQRIGVVTAPEAAYQARKTNRKLETQQSEGIVEVTSNEGMAKAQDR